MTGYDLPRGRRVRVWFDAPDGPANPAGPSLTHAVSVVHRAPSPRGNIVVIELFIPQGGRFSYGLLGVQAQPPIGSIDEVVVDVPVTGLDGPPYADALPNQLDTVRWGLPAEYAQDVLDAASRAILLYGAPQTRSIRFSWAAHGLVSSSRAHFGKLANLVVQLLVAPADADVQSLLEGA